MLELTKFEQSAIIELNAIVFKLHKFVLEVAQFLPIKTRFQNVFYTYEKIEVCFTACN